MSLLPPLPPPASSAGSLYPNELIIQLNTDIPGYPQVRFSPQMMERASSGKEQNVLFNPLYRLSTSIVDSVPENLRKKQFFDQGLFQSLLQHSGKTPAVDLAAATANGNVDNNIEITLQTLFPDSTVLYIGGKPYVIGDYMWTKGDWKIDLKVKSAELDLSKITDLDTYRNLIRDDMISGMEQLNQMSPNVLYGVNSGEGVGKKKKKGTPEEEEQEDTSQELQEYLSSSTWKKKYYTEAREPLDQILQEYAKTLQQKDKSPPTPSDLEIVGSGADDLVNEIQTFDKETQALMGLLSETQGKYLAPSTKLNNKSTLLAMKQGQLWKLINRVSLLRNKLLQVGEEVAARSFSSLMTPEVAKQSILDALEDHMEDLQQQLGTEEKKQSVEYIAANYTFKSPQLVEIILRIGPSEETYDPDAIIATIKPDFLETIVQQTKDKSAEEAEQYYRDFIFVAQSIAEAVAPETDRSSAIQKIQQELQEWRKNLAKDPSVEPIPLQNRPPLLDPMASLADPLFLLSRLYLEESVFGQGLIHIEDAADTFQQYLLEGSPQLSMTEAIAERNEFIFDFEEILDRLSDWVFSANSLAESTQIVIRRLDEYAATLKQSNVGLEQVSQQGDTFKVTRQLYMIQDILSTGDFDEYIWYKCLLWEKSEKADDTSVLMKVNEEMQRFLDNYEKDLSNKQGFAPEPSSTASATEIEKYTSEQSKRKKLLTRFKKNLSEVLVGVSKEEFPPQEDLRSKTRFVIERVKNLTRDLETLKNTVSTDAEKMTEIDREIRKSTILLLLNNAITQEQIQMLTSDFDRYVDDFEAKKSKKQTFLSKLYNYFVGNPSLAAERDIYRYTLATFLSNIKSLIGDTTAETNINASLALMEENVVSLLAQTLLYDILVPDINAAQASQPNTQLTIDRDTALRRFSDSVAKSYPELSKNANFMQNVNNLLTTQIFREANEVISPEEVKKRVSAWRANTKNLVKVTELLLQMEILEQLKQEKDVKALVQLINNVGSLWSETFQKIDSELEKLRQQYVAQLETERTTFTTEEEKAADIAEKSQNALSLMKDTCRSVVRKPRENDAAVVSAINEALQGSIPLKMGKTLVETALAILATEEADVNLDVGQFVSLLIATILDKYPKIANTPSSLDRFRELVQASFSFPENLATMQQLKEAINEIDQEAETDVRGADGAKLAELMTNDLKLVQDLQKASKLLTPVSGRDMYKNRFSFLTPETAGQAPSAEQYNQFKKNLLYVINNKGTDRDTLMEYQEQLQEDVANVETDVNQKLFAVDELLAKGTASTVDAIYLFSTFQATQKETLEEEIQKDSEAYTKYLRRRPKNPLLEDAAVQAEVALFQASYRKSAETLSKMLLSEILEYGLSDPYQIQIMLDQVVKQYLQEQKREIDVLLGQQTTTTLTDAAKIEPAITPQVIPGGQVPGGEVPGGEIPGGQVPGGEVPGGEIPGGQVPEGEVHPLEGGAPAPASDEAEIQERIRRIFAVEHTESLKRYALQLFYLQQPLFASEIELQTDTEFNQIMLQSVSEFYEKLVQINTSLPPESQKSVREINQLTNKYNRQLGTFYRALKDQAILTASGKEEAIQNVNLFIQQVAEGLLFDITELQQRIQQEQPPAITPTLQSAEQQLSLSESMWQFLCKAFPSVMGTWFGCQPALPTKPKTVASEPGTSTTAAGVSVPTTEIKGTLEKVAASQTTEADPKRKAALDLYQKVLLNLLQVREELALTEQKLNQIKEVMATGKTTLSTPSEYAQAVRNRGSLMQRETLLTTAAKMMTEGIEKNVSGSNDLPPLPPDAPPEKKAAYDEAVKKRGDPMELLVRNIGILLEIDGLYKRLLGETNQLALDYRDRRYLNEVVQNPRLFTEYQRKLAFFFSTTKMNNFRSSFGMDVAVAAEIKKSLDKLDKSITGGKASIAKTVEEIKSKRLLIADATEAEKVVETLIETIFSVPFASVLKEVEKKTVVEIPVPDVPDLPSKNKAAREVVPPQPLTKFPEYAHGRPQQEELHAYLRTKMAKAYDVMYVNRPFDSDTLLDAPGKDGEAYNAFIASLYLLIRKEKPAENNFFEAVADAINYHNYYNQSRRMTFHSLGSTDERPFTAQAVKDMIYNYMKAFIWNVPARRRERDEMLRRGMRNVDRLNELLEQTYLPSFIEANKKPSERVTEAEYRDLAKRVYQENDHFLVGMVETSFPEGRRGAEGSYEPGTFSIQFQLLTDPVKIADFFVGPDYAGGDAFCYEALCNRLSACFVPIELQLDQETSPSAIYRPITCHVDTLAACSKFSTNVDAVTVFLCLSRKRYYLLTQFISTSLGSTSVGKMLRYRPIPSYFVNNSSVRCPSYLLYLVFGNYYFSAWFEDKVVGQFYPSTTALFTAIVSKLRNDTVFQSAYKTAFPDSNIFEFLNAPSVAPAIEELENATEPKGVVTAFLTNLATLLGSGILYYRTSKPASPTPTPAAQATPSASMGPGTASTTPGGETVTTSTTPEGETVTTSTTPEGETVTTASTTPEGETVTAATTPVDIAREVVQEFPILEMGPQLPPISYRPLTMAERADAQVSSGAAHPLDVGSSASLGGWTSFLPYGSALGAPGGVNLVDMYGGAYNTADAMNFPRSRMMYPSNYGYPFYPSPPQQGRPIESMLRNPNEVHPSKLAYYITVTMMLGRGTALTPEMKSGLKCSGRYNAIRKSWAQLTGTEFTLAPQYSQLNPEERRAQEEREYLQQNTRLPPEQQYGAIAAGPQRPE